MNLLLKRLLLYMKKGEEPSDDLRKIWREVSYGE